MELITEITGQPKPKPKLLVVDDQAINIQVLHQAFASDYPVFMATSGAQALALCASKLPDLVLLDVSMPGMDGFEVCARLKADPSTRDIPVIFVTAHNDEGSETRGLEAGAVDFIFKPINPSIVRARVKAHITLKLQTDLLRSWAYMDGLTGVHNRRHFDEQLAAEWGRAVRSNGALSVVLLDVDFFKRYNDRYGHQAGDDCLRRVAATIKASLKRSGDQVARYGGEEFVCMLPETDLAAAMQVAQTIRQAILALQIEHADSVAAPVVTVSLGVCSKSSSASGSAERLLKLADAQLYAAKGGGRNQVCGVELTAP
jgi:diguanylate cyclase (GGDEF)-like protein